MQENALYLPKSLPVYGHFDVVVIGGGTAGAAAAISAAEEGLKTLVLERNGSMGGTQTNGFAVPTMFNGIENNPLTPVDNEINSRLAEMGAYELRPNNDGYFNPVYMQTVLEQLLTEKGGKILYFTPVVDVVMDGRKILYAVIYNNGGLQAVFADCFIDASGDAEVCRMSGAELTGGNSKGLNQHVTLRFEVANVDHDRYKAQCRRLKDEGTLFGTFLKEEAKKGNLDPEYATGCQMFPVLGKPNCVSFNGPWVGERSCNAADPEVISEKMIAGRKGILGVFNTYKKYAEGFENAYISAIAQTLGIRESRRVVTEYTLTVDDIFSHAKFPDGIGASNYHLDAHGEANFSADFMAYKPIDPAEHYYEIPYRSLVPKGIDNLLVVGRCAGTDFLAQSTTRIQHTCRYMGEAAGIACRLAIEGKLAFRDVDGKLVRRRMAEKGAVILEKEHQ